MIHFTRDISSEDNTNNYNSIKYKYNFVERSNEASG